MYYAMKRKRGSYQDLPMCTVQAENISMIFWWFITELSTVKQSMLLHEQQNGHGQPVLPTIGGFER
jgi:hypothetical protein